MPEHPPQNASHLYKSSPVNKNQGSPFYFPSESDIDYEDRTDSSVMGSDFFVDTSVNYEKGVSVV